MIYYAKIKIYSEGQPPFYLQSLQTFGIDERDTAHNVETMLHGWQDVSNYEILKISRQPIHLTKYVLSVFFKYQNGSTKTLKFNVNGENEGEAGELTKEIIAGWRHLVSYHIVNIVRHK